MKISAEFESPVLDVIQHRRSRRAYSDQPIEPEKIKSLFEAARWAPSSMNDQPWAYIYATKGQPLWDRLFDALNDSNKVWAKDAHLLVLSLARKTFAMNGTPNSAAKYDLGQANAFLTLQATHLGLNIHQMGGFDHEKVVVNLNIPDGYELGVIMAIGYYGDPESLSDNLRQREMAPRQRYVQNEFVMNKAF
ncbi:MAG TPA: nitroreductase family protein [Cyclobacteriaceae bacterium]|nr:nitroreductase family protein [Cyclobacteriaceae bacterium]